MENLITIIKSRKSIRTFDGSRIHPDDLKRLEQYAAEITNPFDIPVKIVFLDAEVHNLSSPVITGEKLYVAGVTDKKPYADVAFGYSFEQFVLYAWSLGIGTTWIAGTMKREKFELAAGLKAGEMMPCISPLGYPAKKKTVKETLMRKGVGADNRMPAEKLFFENSFDTPISEARKEETAEWLEMVRWAPSAVNKQPWRLVLKDGEFHFYEKKDNGYRNDSTGDLQKIDVGIDLCHFGKAAEGKADVKVQDPGIPTPENIEYIASVTIR